MTDRRMIHIVDDEEAIRRSAGFMLKTSGYTVATYPSGVAFLREVRHVEPGCILLDVRMPEMAGLEVQKVLNERGLATAECERTPNSNLGERYGRLDGLDWQDRRIGRAAGRDRVGRYV